MPSDRHGELGVAQLEALYRDQFSVLANLAITEFHVPRRAAEELAHDVLISGLLHFAQSADPNTWLRGAITVAARHYRESRA